MIKNHLKIAVRNLLKYKVYSFINILGLAIGMACCILILLYIQDELSYDRFHENADRIFRVSRQWFNPDGTSSLHLGHVAPPIAPLLKNDFPDIIHAVRLIGGGTTLVRYEARYFEEPGFYFADPEIFDVFTLPFIKGDPKTALLDPNSVVITEEMAAKYFGNLDPINQVINIDGGADLKVTGVMKSIPHNSHFHVDFLGAMKLLEQFFGADVFQYNWGSNNYATYLLLPKGYDLRQLEAQFPAFLDRHLTAAYQRETGQAPPQQPSLGNKLHLWPLTDIHLYSHLDSEIEPNGDIKNVYIFSSVAFFILLIACINFMNLATARSANRAREVGLRKVVGADRLRLVNQFLGESIVLAFIALLVAVLIVEISLPTFNDFVGKELGLNAGRNLAAALALAGIAVLVGILAGSYPAFFLSRFQPAVVLKGQSNSRAGHAALRKGLVVFQFAISIILIISVGVVNSQLEFCRTKNLGLNKEHVIILPVQRADDSEIS